MPSCNYSVKRDGSHHKSGAPFDRLRVTVHDTLWVCHGKLVESMTAKLPSPLYSLLSKEDDAIDFIEYESNFHAII